MAACNGHRTCDAYEEHPDFSWVLCQRRRGHVGRHRWKKWKWHDDASRAAVRIREMKRIARRSALGPTGRVMSTDAAIVPAQSNGIASQRASVSRELLAIDTEQRKVLAEYVAKHMVKGQDFGVIPGTDKPTLLKPGAEKLTDLFRCTPKFSLVKEFSKEDWEAGFFKYTFRCRLMQRDSEAVLAEGFGSANSRESRYRWRSAKRVCPECGKSDALNKSKPPKQGFYCWDKKGGCGANFEGNDKRITEQVLGRVENVDIADLDNTILKMAKKRALVDGAIALARCSDMFTQDVEDLMEMATEGDEPAPPKAPPESKPAPAPAPQGERRASPAAPRTAREPVKADVVPFEKPARRANEEATEFIAHGVKQSEEAIRAGKVLSPEQKAKLEQVAAALGGTVSGVHGADVPSEEEQTADAIIQEAEYAQTEAELRALAANAKKLTDPALTKKCGAALRAALKRLNITPPPKPAQSAPATRQPGED